MRERNPGLLLILLVAVLGLFFGTWRKVSPPEPASAGATRSGNEPAVVPVNQLPVGGTAGLRSVRPLRDYFEVNDPDRRSFELPSMPDARVDFLITAVPDPIESRFAYCFDSLTDAILMAIESQGYDLDRFWLPWVPSGQQPRRLDDLVHDADLSAGRYASSSAAVDAPPQEREPGVLLFRTRRVGDPVKHQLLVVFLIGESPLSGIHKIALTTALRIIQESEKRSASAMGRGEEAKPRPIRIVGPYFSGSARSLALTLSRWADEEKADGARPIVVYSGSATVIQPDEFRRAAGRANVTFHATVLPDSFVVKALLEYLKTQNRNQPPDKIAMLSESDTTYGSLVQANSVLPGSDITTMKFPFHISQVRIAYIQGRMTGDWSIPVLSSSSGRLKIPFDEVGRPNDLVPALSPAMTAMTDEFLLSKILMTISREDYRYIGILASDTRDTIFLAGLIREFCPDVQLFTNLSDLLLAHPDYSRQLRGMIVASSYPLFSMAQRWTFPFRGNERRHLFHQQSDQGYYNAVLAHFADAANDATYDAALAMIDLGVPFDTVLSLYADATRKATNDAARAMIDYGVPFEPPDLLAPGSKRRPPLWISVVGQRGLWPVHYYDTEPAPVADSDSRSYTRYVFPIESPGSTAPANEGVPGLSKMSSRSGLSHSLLISPQYTWIWGTTFLVISGMIWWLIHAHLLVVFDHLDGSAVRGPAKPWLGERHRRLTELLRPIHQSDRLPFRCPPWKQQLFHAICLTLLSGVVYLYFAYPCLIRPTSTHWTLNEAWARGSWSEVFNWLFGLGAPCLAIMTLAALVLALVSRLGLCGRPGSVREDGWWIFIYLIFLFVAFVIGMFVTAWLRGPSGMIRASNLHRRAGELMFFERAIHLGNGVSPLTPALFLGLVCVSYFLCQLRRLYLINRLRSPAPVGAGIDKTFVAIRKQGDEIGRMLRCWFPRPISRPLFLIGVGMIVFSSGRLIKKFVPTIDGYNYCIVMIAIFSLFSLAVFLTFYRFYLLWRSLRALLYEIMRLPMHHVFDRLPAIFSRTFGRYLDHGSPRITNLTIPVQQWAQLAARFDEASRGILTILCRGGPRTHQIERRFERIAEAVKLNSLNSGMAAVEAIQQAFAADLEKQGSLGALTDSQTQRKLLQAVRACVQVLVHYWPSTPITEGYGDARSWRTRDATGDEEGSPRPGPGGSTSAGDAPDNLVRGWIRMAEELLALELIIYVCQFTVHLRNMATFLTIGPLLLLVTVTSYPFQPERFLMIFIAVLVLTVVTGVVITYIQMDRNEFLSRISKTSPNRITLDSTFITSVLTYITPLLGVVVAEFPDVSDLLNTWVEPMTRIFR